MVESQLPKLLVAGSIPVSRSISHAFKARTFKTRAFKTRTFKARTFKAPGFKARMFMNHGRSEHMGSRVWVRCMWWPRAASLAYDRRDARTAVL